MTLPRVKITYADGAIGAPVESDDSVAGLIGTGVAVVSTFDLGTSYLITQLSDLVALGITDDEADDNKLLYKTIAEFYLEAPVGTKLYFMGVADTVTLTDMVDKTGTYGPTLINYAKGKIRMLMLAKQDAVAYTPVIVDGFDEDVYTAITQAQLLGEWATDTKYAPIFTIIPGRHYTGVAADVDDLLTHTDNRVGVLVGDVVASSKDAAVGLLLGRLAFIPVQRSCMRVKDGALPVDDLFIGAVAAELGKPDVLHDFGYITFRDFVDKTGYFFTDDRLATALSDDYSLIARRRVIDKAYRIGYITMVNELGDEIPVTDIGTIPAPIVKNIQGVIEGAIEAGMTLFGNLGNDPSDQNDTGVEAFIDANQNVVATSTLQMSLKVKPHGYNKYIDIDLGFQALG